MTEAQQTTPAFNLILEGIGYLNRIRTVAVKKGPSYQACTIKALMGVGDDVEKLEVDCKIVGKQALASIELLKSAVADKRKVIVGFRVGDPKPDWYEYTNSENKTETRACLKARLLILTFAKVDGQRVELPGFERRESVPAQESDAPAGQPSAANDAPSSNGIEDDSGAGTACEDRRAQPAEAYDGVF
jgi:Protein of unknown function (DUF3577)